MAAYSVCSSGSPILGGSTTDRLFSQSSETGSFWGFGKPVTGLLCTGQAGRAFLPGSSLGGLLKTPSSCKDRDMTTKTLLDVEDLELVELSHRLTDDSVSSTACAN